jgi:hypothetical protein
MWKLFGLPLYLASTSLQSILHRSGTAHGLLRDCSWIAHGLLMDCPWIAHGLLMDCSWIAHGAMIGGTRNNAALKQPSHMSLWTAMFYTPYI